MYKNSHSRLDGLKLQPVYFKLQVKNNTTEKFRMWDQNRWKYSTICPTPAYNEVMVLKCTQKYNAKQETSSSTKIIIIF